MIGSTVPVTINLNQYAEQNRAACLSCRSAVRFDASRVVCAESPRPLDFVADRCRLRKWHDARPGLPGVWVLSYPRTGSNYLCALLNRLGLTPTLRERYNAGHASVPASIPQNCKVQPQQYRAYALSLRTVGRCWPETRFVVLRRRDLVGCALSLYLAERTCVWEVCSDEQAEALRARERVSLDRWGLLQCYERAVRDDVFWQGELESHGLAYHELFYEDLVDDPGVALGRLHGFLGVRYEAVGDRGVSNRRQSTLRPESAEYRGVLEGMIEERESAGRPVTAPVVGRPRVHPERVIIGVLGCADERYRDRREECRRTWLPELEAAGVEVLFLVGVGGVIDRPRVVEPEEHGRVGRELQIPCPDTYEALPQKTAAFCRWACENRVFDCLFKCDDDTYIVPRRLLDVDLIGVDYLGCPLHIGIPYASGGAGYFLSPRAAQIVSATMRDRVGPEDLIVSRHLDRSGIGLVPDRRFVGFGSEQLRPKPGNTLITSHAYQAAWLRHETTWQGAEDQWRVAQGSGTLGGSGGGCWHRNVVGLDYPEHDLGILTLPKNGGTSLWMLTHQLRYRHRLKGNVYAQRRFLTGPINARSHRLIIVRDPVERFVSGYCFLRRKGPLRGEPGLDFAAFVGRFRDYYENDPMVRHHLRPQFLAAGGTPLSFFTEVIPFSDYGTVFDLVQAITGLSFERPHFQATTERKPGVTPAQREFLEEFYELDYKHGYCDRRHLTASSRGRTS